MTRKCSSSIGLLGAYIRVARPFGNSIRKGNHEPPPSRKESPSRHAPKSTAAPHTSGTDRPGILPLHRPVFQPPLALAHSGTAASTLRNTATSPRCRSLTAHRTDPDVRPRRSAYHTRGQEASSRRGGTISGWLTTKSSVPRRSGFGSSMPPPKEKK
jgi:hypothetical protein